MEFLRTRRLRATGLQRASASLDEVIISALLLSGLKNSEFCALTVGDTVIGTGNSVFVVRGPSGRSRTVYIPRRASALVRQYVSDVRPRFVAPGVDPQDQSHALVLNEHRRPYERTGLYRRVVRILTEAGLGDRASVQLLRHTYGYLAYLRTGGNLLFVQRQLGHAHPRITSVYAKLVDESYADLAERIVAGEPRAADVETGVCARRRPQFDCETD
ncbi:MAG: site-specific integrase [Phycisphaerales bacterium]|nr:MAG: site-specific integrase [Phycisphaerales bacterium]